RGKVRLEYFGQGDKIKRRRRAKTQAQRPTRIITQHAKRRLLRLDRNGVRRFDIRERSCRWWRAWHAATGGSRVGDPIIIQEIGAKQLVIGDRSELALLQRPARHRRTDTPRCRWHTLGFSPDNDKALERRTGRKDPIRDIYNDCLVLGA